MIGMGVREQNRVELFQADAEGLLAEIGRRINQQAMAIMFDEHRRAQPLVARVIRQTSLALAADRRHANRRARAEKSNVHRFLDAPTNCMRR